MIKRILQPSNVELFKKINRSFLKIAQGEKVKILPKDNHSKGTH